MNSSYRIEIQESGQPEVMKLVNSASCPQPRAGELLIRNHAAAVNFIDTMIRRGEMPEGMMPELPFTPGVEGAGVVEALGEGVQDFKIGDRVAWLGNLGAGGYGSHSVLPARFVVPIAEEIDYSLAAALPVNGLTAYHMLVNLGRAQPGQTVLVHAAAGGVGTMALQLGTHLGLRMIASVSSSKVETARAQGADLVVDYRQEDLHAKVMEYSEGRGVDLTLNPVAGKSLSTDLDLLAPFGTAILFGFLSGPPEGTFAEDLARHFTKSIALRVSDLYTAYRSAADQLHIDMQELFRLLNTSVIRPQIDEVFPLQEVAQAHRKLEAGQVIGKVALSIP